MTDAVWPGIMSSVGDGSLASVRIDRKTSRSTLPSTIATMRYSLLLALAFVLTLSPAAFGQGSEADFARSRELAAKTNISLPGEISLAEWIDGKTLMFRRSADAAGQPASFMRLDASTGKVEPLFDQSVLDAFLNQALAAKTGRAPQIERVEVESGHIDLLVTGDRIIAASSSDFGKSWREMPLPEARVFHLDDAERPRHRKGRKGRQGGEGGQSGLILVNTTKEPVKLFWMNGTVRTQYGEVGPGQTRRQHTFVGHRWEVTDVGG
jgi:hypothetical protein